MQEIEEFDVSNYGFWACICRLPADCGLFATSKCDTAVEPHVASRNMLI